MNKLVKKSSWGWMITNNGYDYNHLLHLCSSSSSLRQIHAHIIILGYQHHPILTNRLVSSYIRHLGLSRACSVLEKLPRTDVFLWNIVLREYSKNGKSDHVLTSFNQMWNTHSIAPDEHTLPLVLKATGMINDVRKVTVIHGFVIKLGFGCHINVGNALLAVYGKCESVSCSRKVFDDMAIKDVVTWNSLISAYAANGGHAEALELFRLMAVDPTVPPDHATLVSVLPACAHQAAVREGLWVHTRVVRRGYDLDAALGSGLISMYANVGRLRSAETIFDRISEKNIAVWSAMIRAYGTHGHCEKALKLFSQMIDRSLHPDGIIFLSLISACSHSGMVSQGLKLFDMMEGCGVHRTPQHYACMVDLYSRAGLIDEAIKLMETMPVEAGRDAYGALLGACRAHNNIEVAEEVGRKLFEMDPENPGRYLILVKMYEDAGRYDDVARLRKVLREKGIRRTVGYSEIEVGYEFHRFGVEVESHPLKEQIVDTLQKLKVVMDEAEMSGSDDRVI